MNIDLDKQEDLILLSNKTEFIKGLDYFSKISNENIKNIFYNLTRSTVLRDVDIKFIIAFLFKTKYVEFKDEKINRRLIIDPNVLMEELILFYFSILTNNRQINESLFINSEFSISNDQILINIFSVQIKHRIFFSVLQNLGLLEKKSENGLVIIKNYTLAKKFLERPLRKISPEEFEKELEQKKLNGIIAEKFVVEFEKRRLGGAKEIDWVAEYNVNQGYDIASYNNYFDSTYNRFIEVKSYEGHPPCFFWSRNEYTVAEMTQNKYWLYLVNRKEMSQKGYVPTMIQNPFQTILKNPSSNLIVEKYKVVL
ncbi:DUF3883 domain-containing protein [Flavobacterium pallidum]|uniref:Protein NO VEIN C-terminal domain-containing protein n=1 Tax=Flavobacterium pallidum TaxID=2172098 RepID=A0A2S1SFS3_9FLAO|nr:DUF3883 domain-containing protein [Flavobacterium pallidum]AWI25221.1 hypothetical protein HYN49_04545 [Flavobacterium pallidum]